ncbi:hypothetical protein BUALT_Bualt08G0133600 [Buddleja alternifolia]|uniref:Uncharacterized protein n=1 Tax=Buddleja alternifolia TaxID=168488 RepID=A0AAV6X5H8_9LAMI|nr:hypothetical protein BUALT_Bualt08G0133600 [Buddleja alternifolia]
MKLLSIFLIALLFIQALVEAKSEIDAAHSLSQIAAMRVQGDARSRRERTCATEHARRVAPGVTACHRVLMATKTSAPAMLV